MKRMLWSLCLAAIALSEALGFAAPAAAQDYLKHLYQYAANGGWDPSFGTNGSVIYQSHPAGVTAEDFTDVEAIASAKLITCGRYTSNGLRRFQVMRLLSDGTPDPTFASGSYARTTWSTTSHEDAVAIASSGSKIVVAGHLIQNGESAAAVARFNSDGSPDQTFGSSGRVTLPVNGWNVYAADVTAMPSGKIIVVGTIKKIGGGEHRFVAFRLNSDGTRDTSFAGNGQASVGLGSEKVVTASSVAVWAPSGESSGWIAIGGLSGSGHFALALLTPTGTTYTPFNQTGQKLFLLDGKYPLEFKAVARVDSVGRIVMGSAIGTLAYGKLVFARVLATGKLDHDFNGTGFARTANGNMQSIQFVDMSVSATDEIVILAKGKAYDDSTVNPTWDWDDGFTAARVSSAGILNGTFGFRVVNTPNYHGYAMTAVDFVDNDRVIVVGAVFNP